MGGIPTRALCCLTLAFARSAIGFRWRGCGTTAQHGRETEVMSTSRLAMQTYYVFERRGDERVLLGSYRGAFTAERAKLYALIQFQRWGTKRARSIYLREARK
jgi:hypothetical protein